MSDTHTDKSIRVMIDQAINVYAARKCHRNEFARSLYKKGQLLSNAGNEAEATTARSRAYELRRLIAKEDPRPIDQVCEKDYDRLVIFWNR